MYQVVLQDQNQRGKNDLPQCEIISWGNPTVKINHFKGTRLEWLVPKKTLYF